MQQYEAHSTDLAILHRKRRLDSQARQVLSLESHAESIGYGVIYAVVPGDLCASILLPAPGCLPINSTLQPDAA